MGGQSQGMNEYDVVVIGGGAAGLSAALVLSRARRKVAVVDGGAPRNAPASHMHGFLSRDGLPPNDLLAAGREEVRRYGGEIIDGTVADVPRGAGPGFQVLLAGGRQLTARRLLVATGLRDELPDIPGVRERWGRDVLHCPYCHGYEVRDQQVGVLGGAADSVQHPDLLVAYLVAVAVRAMQDVSAPALADAWDVGQLITKTGGHEHAARGQPPAVCEQDLESRSGASRDVRDGAVDDLAAVTPHLFPSGGQEVVGRKAVAREEPVHVGGGRVAWRPAIHHGDLAPGPGQDQSRRQTGSTPADHHNVVFVHALRLPAHPGIDNDRCCSWELGVQSARGRIDSDGRDTRPGRSAAQATALPTRRHAHGCLGDHWHLEEHPVAPGDRPAPPEP